jgi:ATP-dependent helicase/nuclease subunit A
LAERFLSHLDPTPSGGGSPVELGQLVAFTYTERAAREMRDRIRRKCRERLQSADEQSSPYWLSLLRELDSARVSTVHSFCATLLRSHAVEAGLDPLFVVLEAAAAETLQDEALDDVLRRRLQDEDETTIELATMFGLSGLRERTAALLKSRQAEQLVAFVDRDARSLVDDWGRLLAKSSGPLVESFLQSPPVRRLLAALRESDVAAPAMIERRDALVDGLPKLAKSDSLADDLLALHELAKVQGATAKKFWPDAAVYERIKNAMSDFRDAAKKLVRAIDFDEAACLAAAEAGLKLTEIAVETLAAYDREKQRRRALDFNDLMNRARRLLVAPESATLRRSIARQIRLLMVDESQDVSPLQIELIDALCDGDLAGGKLFAVGDFKQSIYRFLGADPRVFQSLRQRTPPEGRLPLSRNFRSQPAMLDFVNALFVAAFDDYEPLVANRSQTTPTPAVELLWTFSTEPSRAAGAAERLHMAEAERIARRLAGMFAEPAPLVPDRNQPDQLRPARPGDVAILFRGLTHIQQYEAALQRYDIPYYLVGGKAFYAQQEVFDLANLLRAVVSRADEASLIGALRSEMFALADETLFWLARRDGGIAKAIIDVGENGAALDRDFSAIDPSQCEAVQRAAETIALLREAKDRLSIVELLHLALDRTGYDALLLAQFLGERKLANLQKLIEMARRFDALGGMTAADFALELSRFVADQPDEAPAATEAEASDVVRLMTIHQAKGLEFPIVVVADVDAPRTSRSPVASFDPQFGPLVGLPERHPLEDKTTAVHLHRFQSAQDDLDEATRLFYVATTRAADVLILSGGRFSGVDPRGPWTRLLAERFDLDSGALIADLPEGYRATSIRVIADDPFPQLATRGATRRRIDLQAIVDRLRDLPPLQNAPLLASTEPIAVDRSSPRMHSFSRLKGDFRKPSETAPSEDAFDESPDANSQAASTVDPLGFGTLVHAVMADVPYGETLDAPSLVKRHADAHGVGATEQNEASALVERFFATELCQRIAAAAERHAELEFLLAWPNGATSGDDPLLHGFIDLLFRDGDGWQIVDFKTNRTTAADLARAAADYEMQMLLYALAAEEILGEPPVRLTLHFLRPGANFEFPYDAAARDRVSSWIDERLAQAK